MLNKIIHWSISNKLIVGIMTLGLITWGVFSLKNLPIDAVPDITNNQVQIVTSAPSSGAEDIERFVTFPVEQTMATIPGIEEIRSFSRFGLSVVTVVFNEDTDIYWARQQVSERLSEAKNQIPAGFGEPSMAPLSTGLGEIYQYIVKPKKGYEQKFNPTELRTIQDWMIRRQLLGVDGVADVSGFGGNLKQYEIAIDLVRLKGFGLNVSDVFKAVEQNNENTGGAYIERNSSTTYIRTVGLMKSIEDIEQTIISQSSVGTPILVRDVAQVQIGKAVRYGALTYNAEGEAVGGIVMMLKGANSSKVIELVKERMEQIKSTLPPGVEIKVYLDRTKLVNNAISTVSKNLIEGALIVIFVLVLLLGNFRAGLIVASVIPLAMLFAISLMNVFGVSGNLMSLGALDFGLIIDGAVIIVESTLHFLYHRGNQNLNQQQMDTQVYNSASKFAKSAVFGQIIILVVYLPLLALIGIEGKMFKPMAQTVMFAVIGALILSLTYVPMISSLVLSKKIKVRETISDKIVKLVKRIYMPILNAFLRRQKTVLAGLGALIVICIFLFSRLGAEFIPSLDEGDFAVETRLITGTSLTKTIEATSKVSDVLLKNFPEVKEVVGKIGTAEIPTDPMPMEACDLMVILKDKDEWTSASTKEELAEKMQKTLENNVPGVSFGFLQPIQMRFNELMTGAKQDVVVKIYGEDLDKLSHYAGQIGTLSSKIEGVQDVYVEEVTGLPQMIVSYDREALSKYNISIDEVNRSINISFAGQAAGLIFEGEKRFDLVVKLDSTNRQSMEDLKTITVTSPLGVQVPLEQLADVKFEKGPNQIQRDDAKRRIIVGFNVRGRDVESIVKELQAKIAGNVHFEPGYFPTYGGTFKNLENARNRLAIAVPVALFMIFFLLYLTFQSLKQAALIFSAIPLAALGGILALWSRGMPFSISAGVGFIALFGVAVLNGIVLISEFNSLKKEGYTNRLRIVLMGTRVRLRPVMLTALVASLGFLPMALSHGSGAEVQKPLATVVIGGLITATILTLFVLPIFYLFSERKMKVKKRKTMVMTLLFMLSFSLFGQGPQIVSLEQCLSMAKENNPSLKAAEMQIQKEVMIGKGMAEMPKTTVTGMMGQYNSYYSRDNNISVSQSIPFPTVFVKERELGQVKSEQAKVVLFSTWKELALQIESTYESIVLLKNKELLLKRQDSLYTELDKRYAIKYELKDVTHLDAVLVSSKKKEVQNALLMNAQEILNLERQLMFLTGSSTSLSADNSSKTSLTFVDKKDSSVFTAHPQQQYFQTQRMILEKQKEVLLARTLPDITIGYVNQTLVGVHSVDASTDKVFDQSSRFQAGQVGLQIPLFFGASRKKSQVLTNELNQNELNGNYAKQELQSTYLSLLGKYASLLESLNMYDSQLIPQTKIMNDQGKIMLESGEISMIEFLQTKQAIIDIEMNYINLKSEINTTVHQLNWFVQNEN
jgi:cobalt-zinc-cadmium resistance protein CzcA